MQTRVAVGLTPLAENGRRRKQQQNRAKDSRRWDPLWQIVVRQILTYFFDCDGTPFVQLIF